MIIRTLLTTVGALTTASVGYAALSVTAPNAADKIETLIRDIGFGWTADSCEANPEGCLNSRFTELSRLEREVATSITAIRGEVDRLDGSGHSEPVRLWQSRRGQTSAGRSTS
jgi:hypothetical protein